MNIECSSVAFPKMSQPVNLLNEYCSDSEASIQVPRGELIKILKASMLIQDLTSQINLLAINAVAEAVYTGEDDFAIAVNEMRKRVNESGAQARIIDNTLKELSRQTEPA